MHNVWLIARREYLERIRTKAFIIATLLIPILLGGIGFGSVYLGRKTQSAANLAILSGPGGDTFANDLKQQLTSDRDAKTTVELLPNDAGTRSHLDAELKNKQATLSGYLQVLPAAGAGIRPRFVYTPRNASDIVTVETLKESIRSVLTRERFTTQGVQSGEIDALMAPVDIDTSSTGDTAFAFYAAYALFFMMYFVIMQFGMNTARSIIEEKTSRVFEVMLATIKPDEMLAGKILGVGAVGLTQIGVWMVAAAAIGGYYAAAAGLSIHAYVSPAQIIFFVLYFLFGFLIYSSVAAALGAMTNSEQELQQLNMFLVIPLAFCMLMLVTIIKNPDSPLSRIVSLIPFCSPLLMDFRISIGNPQPWEIGLSFVLMAMTIAAILWVASRIYRVGILMYGKKPNLPEILRWLRYS